MRHYGYEDWLSTVARASTLDTDTVKTRYVDPGAAILTLRAGGGCPISDVHLIDVAHGCYRLLQHHLELMPYYGSGSDRVALAVITDYASARGCALDLGRGRMVFITEIRRGGLGETEALRAFQGALKQIRGVRPRHTSLVGYRATISRPVTDPAPKLAKAVARLEDGLSQWLQRNGGIVDRPRPQHRRTSSGRDARLPDAVVPAHEPPATTRTLMTRSINRVTSAHGLFILGDFRSAGCPVEREWALRCRIPVYEFELTTPAHPHADAPNLTRVPIDPDNPGPGLDSALRTFGSMDWEFADSMAYARAQEVKNAPAQAQLQAAWSALTPAEREKVAGTLGMSCAYIDGLISNPTGLALASGDQRHDLERILAVPDTRVSAPPRRLRDSEMRLLADAALAKGLAGFELARAVDLAGQQWTRTLLTGSVEDPKTAQAAIQQVLARLKLEGSDNDW